MRDRVLWWGVPAALVGLALPFVASPLLFEEPGEFVHARTFHTTLMGEPAEGVATLRVEAVSPRTTYGDLGFVVGGERLRLADAADCAVPAPSEGEIIACRGGRLLSAEDEVRAADALVVPVAGPGSLFRALDADANAVIASLPLG